MIITIENFKSIQKLENFEFKPLNFLAGINSSGKTSLTQCIMLLKQTLTRNFAGILNFNGEYVKAITPIELVYGKKATDNFHIGLKLSKEELVKVDAFKELESYDYQVDSLSLDVVLHINENVSVRKIILVTRNNQNSIRDDITVRQLQRGNYKGYYSIKWLDNKGKTSINVTKERDYYKVDFLNFFPTIAEKIENGIGGELISMTLMKAMRESLITYFDNFIYIGPLRAAPVPVLSLSNDNFKTVGKDGLYTRFILHKYKKQPVTHNLNLAEATKKWICIKFGLADDIRVDKDGTNSYRVRIVNEGLEVELYHMGFGLSQILPIVVQGLLVRSGGYFFVDSPEVHMHPSVQSGLVDFFVCLASRGVNVIIETHSDHIITRLRRRIAEQVIKMGDLKLCFVTNSQQGSNYQEVTVDDKGNFYGYLPKGFCDTQDEDFKEIIKARFHE